MNEKRTIFGLRWCGVCGVALWLATACAWGGIAPPLYVGNLVPVKDQYGRPMAGSHLFSGAASRSYLEIRVTTNGIIRPPYTNGVAHPYHPLLTADSVGGVGMNSSTPNSGLFCMVFSNRPSTNIMMFARVFNAPTAAEASFYADSKAVAARTNEAALVLEFGAAKPLDTNDVDGDGLCNSWEKALGIDDRLTSDYDGDGMSDLNEMLAGTAPDDPGSLLAFRKIQRDATAQVSDTGEGETGSRPVHVKWQSVPGKKYQLEYVPKLTTVAGAPTIFIPVGEEVTAEAGEFEIEMQVDVEDDLTGTFRVRLVREPQ